MKNNHVNAYKRLLGMLGGERRLAALTGCAMLLELGFVLAGPWVLGRAVDALEAAHTGGGDVAAVAVRYAALFLGVAFAMNVSRFLYTDTRGRMVQAIVEGLRRRALEKLHALSPAYYASTDSGSVLARVSRDVEKVRPFFGMVAFTVVHLALVAGGSFAILAAHSPALGAVTAACFFASIAMVVRTAAALRPLNRKADDLYDGVALDIKENIEGVKVVKSFGREKLQGERFRKRLGVFVDSAIAIGDCWSFNIPLANALFGLCVPAILFVGGWQVAAGELAKGAVVACLFYAARIASEMNGLVRVVAMAQEASVSAQRLFELLDAKDIVAEAARPRLLPERFDAVRFEGLRFSYREGEPVLRGVDFEVRPGERVALVGPTGAGKSSLISLLLRFFEADAGRILIGGVDIREYALADLRRAIGCVFQETFLFSDTLRRNLAFAAEGVSDEAIMEAVRTARLDMFVNSLPGGLDTVVGERGMTMSGGQRQRTAIARALLSDPKLLVLDDTMASVDARTERELVKALTRAAAGRTTLIVTQRLSGVLLADRVVVMDRGRIVDEGRHAELYERCAVYRALFEGQVLEAGKIPADRSGVEA
jgi:ATP-binding cassette subfamily B protein